MNGPKYLKDAVYYSDLYDHQTVEECRHIENQFAASTVGMPVERAWQTLLVKAALYFARGERYADKFDSIAVWREKDRQRDRHLTEARTPCGIRCVGCFSEMACEERDLHDRDGNEQVLFYFSCPKCDSRRAFYEDGTEYRRQKVFCIQCQAEARTEYQRVGAEINIVTACPKCGRVETESLTTKMPPAPDEQYAADRERFCMSEEEGREYNSYRVRFEASKRDQLEKELRQNRQNLFDEIAKFKKLTVVDLENLLILALERERFIRLALGTPIIKRDVQILFSAQDAKPGRDERDSVKDLKNAIEEALDGTNWRLMSSGISYRLGVLTGYLRGLETEKDLLALARMRLKKRAG